MKVYYRIMCLAGLGLVLSGCAPSSPTFLRPASLIAGHEADLYKEILIESIVIFILIIGALLWILIKDRSRGDGKIIPPQIYGKLTHIAIPVIMIVLLDGVDFVWMFQTMRAVQQPAALSQDINVHVIGHRWWWEYDYSDYNIITANELHVPVGSTVQITLDSRDVIHSFWVPQLTGKTDVIPGQTNHMWLTADQTGVFVGQCAEFCGTEHAMMRIKVIVESQEDFNAWVANQQLPAPQPTNADEQAGYDDLTSVCAACHSLNPSEQGDLVGPNLTHLLSRTTFAGATYDLNEENLRSWLTDTQKMKPGNDMKLLLTPDEIDHVLAYLKLLK